MNIPDRHYDLGSTMNRTPLFATSLIAMAVSFAPSGSALAQTLVEPGQTVASTQFKSPQISRSAPSSTLLPPNIAVAIAEKSHDQNMNRLWITSMMAAAGASGMDAASSWAKR